MPNLFAPFTEYYVDLSAADSTLNIPLKDLILTYQRASASALRISIAPKNTAAPVLVDLRRTTIYDGSTIPQASGNLNSDQNLFNYQAKVLRELLNEESYICVGRAADFVLKDKPNVLTVYIDAPYEDRIEREMKRQGIGRSQAIHYIDKLDHYRESYYKYHTGRQWKRVENYDLCLDSAAVGLDNCVEVIKKVIELKFGVKCPR